MSTHDEIIDGEWRDTDNGAMVKADQQVLARLGTPTQRRAALEILAQSLHIPTDAFDTDPGLHGQLALAIQLAGEYGFVPGEDFHAVKRRSNVDGKWVDVWTIQDGEKAWKKSAHRLGIQYRFQDRPMTRSEIEDYARSIGMPAGEVNKDAAGIWSRVITREDVDWGLVTDQSPIWQAGAWLGKVRQGNKWFDDNLPTGTSPTDVATRRAHKRALMSSVVTLTPIDDTPPAERYRQMAVTLVEQAEQKADYENMQIAQRNRIIEDDGDELFAPNEPFVRATPHEEPEADDGEFSVLPWQDWTEPGNAYEWAEAQGVDAATAKAEYAQLVTTVGGGKHNKDTMPAIFRAFYEHVGQLVTA